MQFSLFKESNHLNNLKFNQSYKKNTNIMIQNKYY